MCKHDFEFAYLSTKPTTSSAGQAFRPLGTLLQTASNTTTIQFILHTAVCLPPLEENIPSTTTVFNKGCIGVVDSRCFSSCCHMKAKCLHSIAVLLQRLEKSCAVVPLLLQFLLEVEELAGLTQRLEPWRRDVFAPLIIEVQAQTEHAVHLSFKHLQPSKRCMSITGVAHTCSKARFDFSSSHLLQHCSACQHTHRARQPGQTSLDRSYHGMHGPRSIESFECWS